MRNATLETEASQSGVLSAALPLLAACGLALVLQLVVYVNSPLIALDGIDFIAFARELDHPVEAMRSNAQHPGYPMLIRGGMELLQAAGATNSRENWILAARIVAMLAGVLVVPVVWQLTRSRYGLAAANAAAILCACWPLLRKNAADALSDSPHLLFYLAAATCFCTGLERRRWQGFVAAGLCSGLAFWIRPEGLSIVLVGGPFLGLLALREIAQREWAAGFRTAGWGALALGTAVLVVAPYLLLTGKFSDKINDKFKTSDAVEFASPPTEAAFAADSSSQISLVSYSQAGSAVPAVSTLGLVSTEIDLPITPSSSGPAPASSPAGPTIRGVPLQPLSASVNTLLSRYFERAHFLALMALVAICTAPLCRPNRPGAYLLALFGFHAFLLFLLFTVAGYIDRRHVIPLVALTFPLAGLGVCRFCHRLAGRFTKSHDSPRLARGFTGGLLALVLVGTLFSYGQGNHYEHFGTLAAIQWAEENVPPGATFVTNSRYAPFYLSQRCRCITLNETLYDSLAENASLRVPCYLLLVENQEPGYDTRWWDEARLMGPDRYHTANTTRRQTQEVTCWEVPISLIAQLRADRSTY